MIMKGIAALLIAVMFVLGFSSQANATLIVRGTDTLGNQLVYDTDFNTTWYDFTNASDSWQNQMNWASALTVDFGGLIGGWRLPTSLNRDGTGPCTSYNCTDSEMGHLDYTELGVPRPFGSSDFTDGLTGEARSFLNLTPSIYWSSTEVDSGNAWAYDFNAHNQGINNKTQFPRLAMAVHDGDVAAAKIPEPATLLIFGSGVLALIGLGRRTKRNGAMLRP